MRYVLISIVFALAVAAALISIDSSQQDYWASFRQNLVAEILGFIFAGAIATWVTWRIARDRLSEVGRPLLHLISQLRTDGSISGPAARKAVILTAKVLGEDAGLYRETRKPLEQQDECGICGMTTCIEQSSHKSERNCGHCGLSQAYWKGIAVNSEASR